jgi:hypothetical protein
LFGEDITYDAIEVSECQALLCNPSTSLTIRQNQMRAIRKLAGELRSTANNEGREKPTKVPKSRKCTAVGAAKKGTSGRGAIKQEADDAPRATPKALGTATISGRISKNKSNSATPSKSFGENDFGIHEDDDQQMMSSFGFDGSNDLFADFGGYYDDSDKTFEGDAF